MRVILLNECYVHFPPCLFVVFIPNYHPLHRTQPPRTRYDHPPARDRERERARAPRPPCCATADDFDGLEFLGAPKRCLSIPENEIDLVSGDTSVCVHNTILKSFV